MKKIFLILFCIIVGLFILLEAIDTSGYKAESEIWKLNQKFVELSKDPKIVPEREFNNLYGQYERFIRRYPDSDLTPGAYLRSGQIHTLREEYDLARNRFEEMILLNKKQPQVAVQALWEIGRTYELEDQFDKMINTYQRAIKEFPYTRQGLKAPLLIAQVYQSKSKFGAAKKQYNEAIAYYRKLIDQYPKTVLAYKALDNLSLCYLGQAHYKDALKVFEEILFMFQDTPIWTQREFVNLVQTINILSVNQMKDYDLPIRIYQRFIEAYPDHSFNSMFESVIEELEELRDNPEKKSASTEAE